MVGLSSPHDHANTATRTNTINGFIMPSCSLKMISPGAAIPPSPLRWPGSRSRVVMTTVSIRPMGNGRSCRLHRVKSACRHTSSRFVYCTVRGASSSPAGMSLMDSQQRVKTPICLPLKTTLSSISSSVSRSVHPYLSSSGFGRQMPLELPI